MLPQESEKYIHNTDLDLRKFINELVLGDRSHLFISIPDFHWVFDDFGYNRAVVSLGYKQVISSLDIIFEKFKPDNFDHIIIFSDHGFKYNSEINYAKRNNNLYLYNEDRIRCLLFHRIKMQNNISIDNKLLSLADVQKIYKLIIDKNNISENLSSRKFVCFEDHINFGYSNFMKTEIFGLVDKKSIYIRSFDKALKLDRFGKFLSNKISKNTDHKLALETTFASSIEYLKKLPQQQKTIIKQNIYTNGSKRLIKKGKMIYRLRTYFKHIKKFLFLS